MPANQDFKDLFALFNREKVEYLVVGAHALPEYIFDFIYYVFIEI